MTRKSKAVMYPRTGKEPRHLQESWRETGDGPSPSTEGRDASRGLATATTACERGDSAEEQRPEQTEAWMQRPLITVRQESRAAEGKEARRLSDRASAAAERGPEPCRRLLSRDVPSLRAAAPDRVPLLRRPLTMGHTLRTPIAPEENKESQTRTWPRSTDSDGALLKSPTGNATVGAGNVRALPKGGNRTKGMLIARNNLRPLPARSTALPKHAETEGNPDSALSDDEDRCGRATHICALRHQARAPTGSEHALSPGGEEEGLASPGCAGQGHPEDKARTFRSKTSSPVDRGIAAYLASTPPPGRLVAPPKCDSSRRGDAERDATVASLVRL
ncbi:hypothetical protein HPB47_020933 [Ixodes persulcatus]|uniref:Uncharacterized protein n=1 Tax=Ixodes persulcatus TaxID=34615 RepID=A0AC60QE21_IXOPE|nr:hypothetical protein HPB47_020933 [Ixodes persulcatus]